MTLFYAIYHRHFRKYLPIPFFSTVQYGPAAEICCSFFSGQFQTFQGYGNGSYSNCLASVNRLNFYKHGQLASKNYSTSDEKNSESTARLNNDKSLELNTNYFKK